MPSAEVTHQIAELIETASEGTVSRADALAARSKLTDLGLSSLAYLRLIDSIENEYGVYVDLEEAIGKLGTAPEIAEYLATLGIGQAG